MTIKHLFIYKLKSRWHQTFESTPLKIIVEPLISDPQNGASKFMLIFLSSKLLYLQITEFLNFMYPLLWMDLFFKVSLLSYQMFNKTWHMRYLPILGIKDFVCYIYLGAWYHYLKWYSMISLVKESCWSLLPSFS